MTAGRWSGPQPLIAGIAGFLLLATACAAEPEPAAEAPVTQEGASPEEEDAPSALEEDEEEQEAGEDTATTPPDEDAPVPELLDFTSPTLDGEEVAGADYAGDALALWFWAPW